MYALLDSRLLELPSGFFPKCIRKSPQTNHVCHCLPFEAPSNPIISLLPLFHENQTVNLPFDREFQDRKTVELE